MAKKKNKLSALSKILFFFGTIYVLEKIFERDTETQTMPGIAGLKGSVRKMIPYTDKNGNNYFLNELEDFDDDDASEIISNMIMPGRRLPSLKMPFFKTFSQTTITGELRYDQFRILLYKIDNENYLILNAFKKKSNATPRSEIKKAEKRIAEFKSRV